MIDVSKIKIAGEWTGHVKFINYDGITVGYLRKATGHRVEAISLAKFGPCKVPLEGDSVGGHKLSMLIAAYEMIKKLLEKDWSSVVEASELLTYHPSDDCADKDSDQAVHVRGKILVVDDELSACIGLTNALKDHHQVDYVTSGKDALNFIPSHVVDLILLDLLMPDMTGIEFLKELCKSSYYKIKVIVCTAYAGVETYIESMNLGAYEYINKPVKQDELLKAVNKALRK